MGIHRHKKQELRDRIIELITGTTNPTQPPGYARAPVFIILCGDPRTEEDYHQSVTPPRRSSDFISNLVCVFLYIHLAATTLGLATQWVSAITRPQVQGSTKDLLGVPEELEFYAMLALGHPDTEPKLRLVRAKEEMVHYDYYDKTKFRTEQQIKDFIASVGHGHGHGHDHSHGHD